MQKLTKKMLGSDPTANLTLTFCGVVLPWLGVLVQALRWFGVIPMAQDLAMDLTQAGRFWVHPDRDVQIYIPAVGLILIFILLLPWSRIVARDHAEGTKGRVLTLALGIIGSLLFLLPIFAWRKDSEVAQPNLWALALYLLACAVVSFSSAFLSFHSKTAVPATENHALDVDEPGLALPKLNRWDAFVLCGLAFFIFIPNTEGLAGRFFQIEEFYHWNAYAVSAALAYLKGGVLYGSFIPQYGVGWPLVFATIHPFFPLSYAHVLDVAMLVAIAYYFSVFFFIRTLGFSRLLAFAATFLCVAILILPSAEPETKSLIWRWGGGASMRSPLDFAFFSALLLHLKNPRRRSACLVGALAGLNLLFSIDGGLFLMATMVSTWGFYLLFTKLRHALNTALYSTASALAVLSAGLLLATRGELFSKQILTTMLGYAAKSAGEALLPFAGLDAFWVAVFCLLVTALFYTVAQAVFPAPERRGGLEVLAWSVGVYGLQRIVYFMGRTTWSNLLVLVVPAAAAACVIAACLKYRRSKPRTAAPLQIVSVEYGASAALILSAFSVVVLSRDTPNYPALWNGSARRDLAVGHVSFPSKSVGIAALPDQYFPYVQSMSVAAERLRELQQKGQSVCALDSCATTFYLVAGVAPYGTSFDEFAEATTSKKEALKLANTISDKGPDVLLLNRAKFPWPRALASEAWQTCRDAMFNNYRRGEEHGPFEFWYRRGAKKTE